MRKISTGKLSVIFMTISLLATGSASAFKPNDAGHLGVTSTALSPIQRVVDGETLKFSERAIKQIRDANKDTDCLSCQADAALHFDDEAFTTGTTRLQTLKTSIISKITAASPNGESARRDLGGALHTLQDFYAHTNWVELGNSGIDNRLGRSTYAGLPVATATCPSDPATLGGAGLTDETSGWFKVPLCVPPEGKCRHGIPVVCPDGLNKDDASRPGHTTARALAVDASKDFIDQILDAPGVAGDAKAIKALMDIKGTLGVIIDDTGSMGLEIAQVKAQVAQIVNSVVGTEREPDEYLLVRFGDPDVGPPFQTSDAGAFLAAVNALSPGGGGDCPELSQSALLQAVSASRSDSTLFLFTDANAKDASLAGNVNAAAQSKRIKITPLLTGTCSPIDPAYIRNAEETGGQLFLLDRPEVDQVFALVEPQLSGDFVTILLASGTLAGDSQEFEIPVDSSITNVVFSVSLDIPDSISVLHPTGVPVVPGDPGVTITDLSSGRIITVNAAETGIWRLQVTGTGTFSVAAQANSSIQFISFQFVELTGRPAHEGFFPIPGQPVAGSDQTGLASLVGPFATASFTLVSETGATIQPVILIQGNPDAAADEFVGSFGLPSQPFRVAVSGVTTTGLSYERLFPALFRAQAVEVTPDTTVLSLPAGAATTVRFSVHNLGDSASFNIVVTDNRDFITRVQPTLLTLDTGASGVVEVDVTVPEDTPAGTRVLITATATGTADPTVTNSATLDLPVALTEAGILNSLSPARVWVGLKNSDAVGLRLDLLAEIFLNETKVGEGRLNNVASGSSGFNNAKLNTVPLTLFAPVAVPANAAFKITLSVRRTCSGGGHNSGTPRLWYNDSQANSRFGATIADTTSDFFLRNGFVLTTTAGMGPKKTIDVPVDNKTPCLNRPFKPFGTWSLTLP